MRTVKCLTSKAVSGVLSLVVGLSLFSPGLGYARAQGPKASNLNAAVITAKPYRGDIERDKLGYAPNELLVKLADTGGMKQEGGKLVPASVVLRNTLSCLGLSVTEEVLPGVYKFSAKEGVSVDVARAKLTLAGSPAVSYAQENRYSYLQATPNDEQYVGGQQWGLTQIKSEQAWDVTTGSSDIVVAVLDTGAALDHPDLADKIVPGYDFVNNDSNPQDDEGHGTMTAGIIGASTNNGTGIAGVSWGARLMPIKVCSNKGSCSDDDIAKGIRFAVDHGARIINASLGGDEDSDVMREAVKYMNDRNVLLVASAGNSPDGKSNYPAAYDGVLAVGGTGRSDTYVGFSSYGLFVDVSAPGVGILSTGWDNGNNTYEYGNGTSFSGPFVAGVAALVWSANPSLTAQQVRYTIMDSSDDLGDPGPDVHYGAGRVNAFKAVTMAKQGPPAARTPSSKLVPPTATPGPSTPPTATVPASQGPALQVDSKDVQAGSLMALTGSGFAAGELIDLSLLSSDSNLKPLGSAQASAQGGFKAEIALPKSVPTGKAVLSATGGSSKRRAVVELNVLPGQAGAGGQSVVKGLIRGVSGAAAQVRLKPSLGVSGPDLTAQTDVNGLYTFSKLASGIYSLTAAAPGYLQAGPFSVQVDGTANDVKSIDITLATTRPKAFDRVAAVNNTAGQLFFPQVGHTLKGSFLKFWQANGGLPIFGFPLSEEYQEVSATNGKTYTVQYFERNRFEYHPEFAGTKNEVLMGLLGNDLTRGRNFPPGAAFQSTSSQAYFKETRHSLSGPFLKYWQSHGGLPIFGYPISEELMENGYLVQYFERNRFEYHPEFAGTPNEVLLGLLGVEMVKLNGWIAP